MSFFDFKIAEDRKKDIKACFGNPEIGQRDVYLFGAGVYADRLKKYLESKSVCAGIEVKGLVVDDSFVDKVKYANVLPLSKLGTLNNVCLIYALGGGYSKSFFQKIKQVQKEMEKCKNSSFVVPSDFWMAEAGFPSHEVIDPVFLKEHFDDFKQTYEMLVDDLSKKVMSEYLYACICHDASKLADLGSGWDFDYDLGLLFDKCGEGVVIECGAFDGKTIAECSTFTKNKYEMLALECDNDNYEKCCEKVRNFPNIKVVKFGAWDKTAKLAIVQKDSASYLKEIEDDSEYENIVEVVDVDSLVGSKRVAALIMDIEGSELNALKGAQNAIKGGANLAVRVYHKKEDLITIPQYIKSLNSAYKFYLRFERGANLCRTGDETTLYAICE